MRPLSTALLRAFLGRAAILGCAVLSGCAAHLGVAPVQRLVGPVAVMAPTVELAVSDDILAAVDNALAARGAVSAEGEGLLVWVDAATFDPFAGTEGGRVYRARLAVRFEFPGGEAPDEHRVERVREVPDPGSAGLAAGIRREVLRSLADEVAADGAAWVASLPARP